MSKVEDHGRKKADSRGSATRTALLDAAETMFGASGFEAVSTRDIGVAIGSSNSTVVGYHFGSKDDLIEAIYLRRLPDIESRRQELLARVVASGRCDDVRALLEVLWHPLFEQVDQDGRHSYAMFLGRALRERFDQMREHMTASFQATRTVVDMIAPHLPYRHGPIWDIRWPVATNTVLDALRRIDQLRELDAGNVPDAKLVADAVSMGQAVLIAPVATVGQATED